MNLDVRFDPYGLRTLIRGTEHDLNTLQDTLEAQLQQLTATVGKPPVPTWIRRSSTELEILSGIVAWGMQVGFLEAEMIGALEVKRIADKRMRVLQEAGLLRWYQAEAAAAALAAPLGRGVLKLPTGAGKTRIAAAIIAGGRGTWLYVVNNQELATQTAEEFVKLLPQMTNALQVLDSEEARRQNKSFPCIARCCSYGQIASNGAPIEWDGLIVDECHGLPAKTRAGEVAKVQAAYRIGMSATPIQRMDCANVRVIGLLGPILYELGVKQLQEEGYLARGEVIRYTIDHSKLN